MGLFTNPAERDRIARETAAIGIGGQAGPGNLAKLSWAGRQEVLRREQDARAEKARKEAAAKSKSWW